MSPFLTAAHLQSQALGDYTSELNDWSEWVMTELPRTEEGGLQHITYSHEHYQQLWDDTLMMTVLPLTKIGLLFGRTNYLEEAKRQFLLHIKYLADRKTGFWFHGGFYSSYFEAFRMRPKLGWTFDGRHNFAQARWARGNCWVTIAIPDFLELLTLSQSDGMYMFLVATLRVQVDALLGAQDPETGLWHTILDDPTTYLEASATAGFAYGILKSLRLGLIETSKIEACKNAAFSAIKGILANINKKGELERTSFGTPVFDEIDEYNRVPVTTMPYGQSLALLALTEYLKTF
jgi:unsaturated rhamnogalacturonyl hydrolase